MVALRKALWVSKTEAISKIEPGKRIFVGSGSAEPQALVGELVAQHERFQDNEICHLFTTGIAPYVEPRYARAFRHNAFFIGANVRKAVQEGRADYTPIFLSEIAAQFARPDGKLPLYCALVQIAPPNEWGMASLGVSVDIVLSAIEHADIVIAQVNRKMPFTRGQAVVPITAFDYLVEAEEDIVECAPQEQDDVSRAIGALVAERIRDGDTLQVGIGRLPDAVLGRLTTKQDLGIHTEMFSDGVMDLIQCGAITNHRKGLHNGVAVTSFVLGSKRLYDFVHENRDIWFMPTAYVNDPEVIRRNQGMTAINAALEVDLSGQVCADSLGGKVYSGIGGQVDFVRGAHRSNGGRSFICLPSTAKGGTVSRITPTLSNGAGVVTSRGDVQFVVTEYGIADLHATSLRQRAEALIRIAHPDFRAELQRSHAGRTIC